MAPTTCRWSQQLASDPPRHDSFLDLTASGALLQRAVQLCEPQCAQAVWFVLSNIHLTKGGEIFVPKIGAMNMAHLAKVHR